MDEEKRNKLKNDIKSLIKQIDHTLRQTTDGEALEFYDKYSPIVDYTLNIPDEDFMIKADTDEMIMVKNNLQQQLNDILKKSP